MAFKRAGFAFSIGLTLAACAAPASDDAAASGSAIGAAPSLAEAGFVMHIQPPLPAVPGTAAKSALIASRFEDAKFLPASCVTGAPDSTLAMMLEGGSKGLGQTGTSSFGVAPDGKKGFGTPVRTTVDQSVFRPQVRLDMVDEFARVAGNAEARVAGAAQFHINHNAFSFSDPKRTRAGAECGTHWVRTVSASRFLSFAVAIDFPSPTEAEEYVAQFGGVNAVLIPTPALQTFLREEVGKLSFHVLVSKEMAGIVTAKLKGDSCTVDNLAGCRKAFDHLMEVAGVLGTSPGDDDTLPSVTGPAATWGIYSADFATYDQLADLPTTKP